MGESTGGGRGDCEFFQVHGMKIFLVSKKEKSGTLLIQCNANSYCEHITGGRNVHFYVCGGLLAPTCDFSFCLCLCLSGIKSEYCNFFPRRVQGHRKLTACCIEHTTRSIAVVSR